MSDRGYMMPSKSDNWTTPGEVVDAVRVAFGGAPDLDPCSGPGSIVGAREEIVPPRDGLVEPWLGQRIYVNPPFSKADLWVERCAQVALLGRDVVLLIKAATDTARWARIAGSARIVCFVRGRLTFGEATQVSPFPVAVVAWNTPGFERAFGPLGSLWRCVR